MMRNWKFVLCSVCLLGGAALAKTRPTDTAAAPRAAVEDKKLMVPEWAREPNPERVPVAGFDDPKLEVAPREPCADGQNCPKRREAPLNWSDDSTGTNTMVENPQGQEPPARAKRPR